MSHTLPVFQSAAVSADGLKVILTYGNLGSDRLSSTTAPPSAFDVRVNGTSATINSVTAGGTTVELTLATAIESGDSVSLYYTKPNSTYAIQNYDYGEDAANLSNVSVTNNSTSLSVDSTPPEFAGISFPWPHVRGIVGDSAPGFDLSVKDAESTITEIEVTFVSPDGTDEATVNIDPTRPAHGTTNTPGNQVTYRVSDWMVPESDPPGSVQGGFWSIKGLRIKDSYENERLYVQDELPNAGFWLNNSPLSAQSFLGRREIGQTLTIDTSTIIDPDIDNLPAGSFAPSYQYRWQVSEDGTQNSWQDIGSQATYTLSEADANKYFRSIVSYKGKDGIITESVVSDSFQFTEGYSGAFVETFEDGSSNGWKNSSSGADVLVSSQASVGNFLGRLGGTTSIEKTYATGGGGVFSFDFLAFDSFDAGNGDGFSVQVDGIDVFSRIHNYNQTYDKSVDNGVSNGFAWSLDTIETFNAFSSWNDTRIRVSIEIPDDIVNPTIKITSKVDQNVDDESGGIDNILFDWDMPAAAPLFSSLDSATVVEKDGSNIVVYRAAATDRSGVEYSLNGADPSLFSIDSSTGDVQLLEEANLSTRQAYSFTVRATDPFGNYSDKNVNLAVEDSSLAFWKEGGYRVDDIALKDSLPSGSAIALTDGYNRKLSDQISRTWDGISVIKSNDGYRMLQIAERGRRRGQYRIAELNGDGVLQSVGGWVDKTQAIADRYQELFEVDLNDDGQAEIPVATDLDLDGFADGLDFYQLVGSGKVVDFSNERGRVLRPSSRSWSALVAKEVGDGFSVLIQGLRGRTASLYQVWDTDATGKITNRSSWVDGNSLTQQGYESTFNKDFNNDSFVGAPVISPASDANGDGFVDGLGHYMLIGSTPSNAVDLTGERGRLLSPNSSRHWDALQAVEKPDGSGTGFDVLIKGKRGRRSSQYQVWSTDANGRITNQSSWLDGNTLAQEGYETTFNKDFNGDALIGTPSGPDLKDEDFNGFVDGISHYALLKGTGDTAQFIDLKDRRGRVLSDSSSRSWNAIQANDNGNGFEILVQGERGRRRSQYLLWKADSSGLITEQSGWLSGNKLALDGYEVIFGTDFNNNGSIGF